MPNLIAIASANRETPSEPPLEPLRQLDEVILRLPAPPESITYLFGVAGISDVDLCEHIAFLALAGTGFSSDGLNVESVFLGAVAVHALMIQAEPILSVFDQGLLARGEVLQFLIRDAINEGSD